MSRTVVAGAAGVAVGSPTQVIRPASSSTAPGCHTVSSASTVKTASACSRTVTGSSGHRFSPSHAAALRLGRPCQSVTPR